MTLDEIRELCDSLYHGPCFPLRFTERFQTWRIEDSHGNVVIEAPRGADMIDLPEAREGMILAINILPFLLDVMKGAKLLIDPDHDFVDALRQLGIAFDNLEKACRP